MNLGEIKERIFRNTNHVYQDQFHMRDLVNEALNILANDAKLEGQQTYNVTAGVAEYALPALYKSPRALIEGTIDNPTHYYDLIDIAEYRVGYSIYNGKLILRPTPGEDKTLTFHYYKWATPVVNDADVPEIDPQYHDALAAYASAMILSLPGMQNVNKYLIDRYFAAWEEARSLFKRDMTKKRMQTAVRRVEGW